MIGRGAALICGALSVLVHLGGTLVLTAPAPIEMAGTMPAAARLGNSFADVAAGHAVSVPGPANTSPTPVTDVPDRPATPVLPPAETVEAKTGSVETFTPVSPNAPEPMASPAPAAPVAPAPSAIAPVAPTETIAGTEPDDTAGALESSLRPRPRPEPEPERAATPDPAPEQARVAESARPSGAQAGAAEAERSGLAEGTAEGTSRDASGEGAAATQAGNAASSNYPGVVMRKINRTRKPTVGARGTATVGFEIAADGALARVVLLGSSGHASIDAAAVDHVQRAAPFPAPPPGAQRRFQVAYESRG
jgi:periplasmic protein TonB